MLIDFEDTQKEILYRHRVDISADRKRRTASAGPASKVEEWRCQFFNLLYEHDFLVDLRFLEDRDSHVVNLRERDSDLVASMAKVFTEAYRSRASI